MNALIRIMDRLNRRVIDDLQAERAVSLGFMREPAQSRPTGIGSSNHGIERHPSDAPYPYIVDDGRPG